MTLLVATPPRSDVLHARAKTRAAHERLRVEVEPVHFLHELEEPDKQSRHRAKAAAFASTGE